MKSAVRIQLRNFGTRLDLSFMTDNKVIKIGPLVLGSFGIMKSGEFHGHGIRWISWWNPVDFMPNEPNEPRTYKYYAYLACNVYLYWIS